MSGGFEWLLVVTGRVDISDLNRAVSNVLRVKFATGVCAFSEIEVSWRNIGKRSFSGALLALNN